MMETPQEQAARIGEFLKQECELEADGNLRKQKDRRGFMLLIWEPENMKGEITYIANFPREVILQFMAEFIERNKPARGKNREH